jgi:choline-sulfatase
MPDLLDPAEMDPHTARIHHGIEADTVGFTPQQTRAARHGYYASTSYFDDWVGRLARTLEGTGQLDNTVVIVASDHGDMLGDRGVWFKMSFHERSARVPLIMAGPGVHHGSVPNACSHLDLLPTLLDIAADDGQSPELGVEIDGRSLWESASGGTDPVDEAFGEYCGEMTSHPMFMIRRGPFKYIHCDSDPPLLFNVGSDPLERTNLADDPDDADTATAFATEVTKRWDSDAIRERVLRSQRARRTLHAAMSRAPLNSWDYAPVTDVANIYVRNHMDWAEAGGRSRL